MWNLRGRDQNKQTCDIERYKKTLLNIQSMFYIQYLLMHLHQIRSKPTTRAYLKSHRRTVSVFKFPSPTYYNTLLFTVVSKIIYFTKRSFSKNGSSFQPQKMLTTIPKKQHFWDWWISANHHDTTEKSQKTPISHMANISWKNAITFKNVFPDDAKKEDVS